MVSGRIFAGWMIACAITVTAFSRPANEGFAATDAAPQAAPYFGQPVPGMTPAPFAPGVVNTGAIELNGVFTPDLREFFFTRLVDGVDTIYHSVLDGVQWSAPRPLRLFPNQARAVAVDMAVSPDGQELYFLGQYPPGDPNWDLWVSRRVNGAWATATLVPPPISTSARESYPAVVADGSLYFASDRPGGRGRSDVYRAQRQRDGSFAEPVNIGPPVNTEFSEGDTFVAPDESYLIVASTRPQGFGQADLYISFKDKEGRWTAPVNMGERINTEQTEFCPMATPDGRYLFFSRRWGATWEETTAGDVYWMDARVIEEFR